MTSRDSRAAYNTISTRQVPNMFRVLLLAAVAALTNGLKIVEDQPDNLNQIEGEASSGLASDATSDMPHLMRHRRHA